MDAQQDTNRTIDGCAYVSGNGKLVIDRHASDQEHLLASQTRGSQPLYDCRTYVDEIFPRQWMGVRGRYEVSYVTDAARTVVSMQVTFTPDAPASAGGTARG